jgi:hypothetical protein
MTSTESTEMSAPMAESTPPEKATVLRVFKDQRKTAWVALAMMVASYWIAGQLDRWQLASCIAGGVLLGFLNHLATEYWLLKTITSGEQPTRRELAIATGVRLVVLTVAAVAIAVIFWPDGIGLLLGLAIFRLIALVMTSIPLLRQLKKEINP